MSSPVVDLLGPELQTANGLKPTSEIVAGKKVIGIYFSGINYRYKISRTSLFS